jgi:ligand-binding sensor domain-containing protein
MRGILILLACCSCACALNPTLDISQYAHKALLVRDRFVKGSIHAIAQTPDGYLWLATELGLFRFDGIRTVAWEPRAGESLPRGVARSLFVARQPVPPSNRDAVPEPLSSLSKRVWPMRVF